MDIHKISRISVAKFVSKILNPKCWAAAKTLIINTTTGTQASQKATSRSLSRKMSTKSKTSNSSKPKKNT